MDYTGKWKIKSILVGTDSGFEKKPIDTLIAECSDEDEKKDLLSQKNSYIDINTDGKVYFYMPIPPDLKDKSKDELLAILKEEGIEQAILTDTHLTMTEEALNWENRGDDLYVHVKTQGYTYDDDGNEVPMDPWEKWTVEGEDGVIRFFTAEYEKM